MNTESYAQILLFGLSVLTLWYFFFWIYKRHSVEIFRQKMFELRDQLFDEAMAGGVSFDHPAYKILRTTMNGFLRFGHRVTLLEFILTGVFLKKSVYRAAGRISFNEAWGLATKNVPKGQMEKLESYRQKMNDLVVIQAFLSTPFFLLFLVVGLVLARLPGSIYELCKRKVFNYISSMLKDPLNSVESTAMVCGSN